jgi:transcriptional regulator with XRE-family HTH domain
MTGIELKIERIKQGRKQLDLARQIGMHSTRLSKIENGWEQPRPEELDAIRHALHLDEQYTETEGSLNEGTVNQISQLGSDAEAESD